MVLKKIKEICQKIPQEYIILFLIVFITLWMVYVFRILYFGCFNPIVTINTSNIDKIDCKTLANTIILDNSIPSNRTMYCKEYDKTRIKTDYYGQEYLRKVYNSKCIE